MKLKDRIIIKANNDTIRVLVNDKTKVPAFFLTTSFIDVDCMKQEIYYMYNFIHI